MCISQRFQRWKRSIPRRPDMDEEFEEVRRTKPRLVTFVQSVMAFKRLARKMKRWRHLDDSRRSTNSRGPSALFMEVRKTAREVKRAAGGYHVINVSSNDIAMTRMEMKKHRMLAKRERKRAEDEALHEKERLGFTDTKAADAQNTYHHYRSRRKEQLASHLDHMQNDFDKEMFAKLDANLESADGDQQGASNDVAHLLQRNQQLSKDDKKTGSRSKSSSDKIDYLPGTTIYFGSTVALQGRHGGFMSYANAGHVKASAHKILSYARYVIVNCDDPSDTGLLRYGDAVWLRAGVHEVLGAQYVSQKNGASLKSNAPSAEGADGTKAGGDADVKKEREIVPALVNSRKENAFKAHQYGRWIVLNRDRPLETLGEYITHLDKCMFEQGWFFLCSHTPYDSSMQRKGSFEEVAKGDVDAFKPGHEATWNLHLVALPSDQGGRRAKTKQGAEVKAFEQIQLNKEFRISKQEKLMGRLEDSLPNRLSMDNLMMDDLGHKLTHQEKQHNFLRKYLKQSDNHFTTAKNDIKRLAIIYGADSFVVDLAKQREIIHEQELGNTEIEKEMERHLHDRHFARKKKKDVLLDDYWDMAGKILLDTRAWHSMQSGMLPYYTADMAKKFRACQVIARFLGQVKKKNLGFLQMMHSYDKSASDHLTQKLAETKLMLYTKSGFTTKKSEIDRVVNEQAEKSLLADMDEAAAARMKAISDSVKTNDVDGAQTLEAQLTRDDKAAIAKLQASVANSQGGSIIGNTRTLKSAQGLPLKPKQELSFRGYNAPNRPRTAPGPSKDSYAMTKLTAMPVPKYMSVFTEYGEEEGNEAHGTNNNTFLTSSLPQIDGSRPGTAPLPKYSDEPELLPIHCGSARGEGKPGNIMSKSTGAADYGESYKKLPKDIMSSRKFKVSLSTSISFLRAASKTPGIYDDVKASRRTSSSSSSKLKSRRSKKV